MGRTRNAADLALVDRHVGRIALDQLGDRDRRPAAGGDHGVEIAHGYAVHDVEQQFMDQLAAVSRLSGSGQVRKRA